MKIFSWVNKDSNHSTIPSNNYLGLLICLILVDLIIIGLNFYNSWIPDDQWTEFFALASDDSIGEYFQYVKWFLICVLFVCITIKRSSLSFFAWFFLFLYLLLDDSLSIHENIGASLMSTSSFEAPFGLRLQDIGELLVSAIAGSILLLSFIWAFKKGDGFFKTSTFNMFYLFLALVFFGVFFDVIAVMIYGGNPTLAFIFDVIEDGGEMIVASFMFWYAVLMLDAKELPISLFDSIRNLLKFKTDYKYV